MSEHQPSEQTKQWYRNLQQGCVVDEDAHGNTDLRPRDR